ncbi:helix-turn-helix domain-containing protein [Noviherbaspirillum saxi]|nr:RodZ domain-containing protein [Noviherbaspirillum saxi]
MSDAGINDAAMSGDPSGGHPILVSPGAQLAAHRQERGWSIEQVASQLNLAPRQVAAIEADDYPSLPGMAIVRGFVRQYAKLLKIDATPLLASLGGETVLAQESIRPRQSLSTPFSEARLPSMTERHGAFSSRWIFGVLAAVLAGAAGWVILNDKDIADMSKAATSQVKDGIAQMTAPGQPSPAAEPAVPLAPLADLGSVVEQPLPVPPSNSETAPTTGGQQAATTPNASAALPQSAQSAGATTGSSTPAVAAGKDALVINARQDSWVEIKRTSGSQPMLSRLLKAGESASVEVTEPVSVVFGNAAGVDASLRGSAIELKVPGNGNIARLTLK